MQTSSLPEKNSPRDEHVEAFVVHVTSLNLNSMPIYPAREAQIASLVIEKVKILALDENVEAFIMHVTYLSLNLMAIHPAREAQIALLVIEEVHLSGPHQCLSLNKDQGRWRIKDGFPHPIWPFQISKDAVWTIKCTGELLGLHQ